MQSISSNALYSADFDNLGDWLEGAPASIETDPMEKVESEKFLPVEPTSWNEAGLTEFETEKLVAKLLLFRGNLSGRGISERLHLPFFLLEPFLWRLTQDQLLAYLESAPLNDYVYQLTDFGRERAKRFAEECAYEGTAPVLLDHYIRSVHAQSVREQCLTRGDLQRVCSDLLLPQHLLNRLGPAVNSGRALLLYGAPGNGKTSIAERVSHAFDELVWIPRVLSVDHQIIRLFDPLSHEEVPLEASQYDRVGPRIDHRWVRIRRPMITVGGELTLDSLETTFNASIGIGEAPLQLKSNCGTLVIDDFGRQRISVEELLNRWIVPLEKRYDFLTLPSGRKLQVPFDCLVIFSTNLSSNELNDEGFLRRIPYKIEVPDPSEADFRSLLQRLCHDLEISHPPRVIDGLIDRHYKAVGRSFRYCHPRDLLLQIRGHCYYHGTPMELTEENVDAAVANYFDGA